MKIAVTGHRPPKLGGYKAARNFQLLREHMKVEIAKHPDPILISGCALGIDQIWAEAGFELGIDVIAALPFAGFDAKWPRESRAAHERLIAKCKQVVYVCEPGYSPDKLQQRNVWMVDNSDLLVAYWNGSPSGTANCLEYATSKGHQVIIFNPEEIINV